MADDPERFVIFRRPEVAPQIEAALEREGWEKRPKVQPAHHIEDPDEAIVYDTADVRHQDHLMPGGYSAEGGSRGWHQHEEES